MSGKSVSFIIFGGILWSCCLAVVLALQRPAPRYSQQFMPETSFTCRNKIVGSYYADPETDCQLFHVCVSVAGVVQDYKFLCPNDTAFDQESQTCADWYDVDCEAATLYYASDNFDLYRLGSGLESLHYDSVRSDAEPQDHLQRSESNDPVRSAANSLNRVSPTVNYNNNNKDVLRGSGSSSNFYNSRYNAKDEDYDSDKTYLEEPVVEPTRKPGVRKVARKQHFNSNNNNNFNTPSTTLAPNTTTTSYNYNNNNNYNNRNYYNQRTTYEATTTTTTVRPDYNNNNNNYNNRNAQKFSPSTFRPSTTGQYTTYQALSTTARTTAFSDNYNTNYHDNYDNHRGTTPAAASYTENYSQDSYNTNYNNNYKNYNNNNNNNGFNQYKGRSSTVTSTNTYQTDFTGFPRNYNNIQRSSTAFPSTTTAASTYYDPYSASNQFTGKTNGATTKQNTQTTKFYPNYSTFAPTTYAPPTSKPVKNNDNGQYYDRQQKSSTFFDVTKAPKKGGFNNFESSGKFFESSTANYDFRRSPAGIGFSPSSINLLAESPKTTTPVPRRNGSPTTYNPNSYNSNNSNQRSQSTTPRPTAYSISSAKPFSTTTKFNDVTTLKLTKSAKKNDYDYAYYDNAGLLEYDGLDLEHVADGKESAKIARN